MKNKKFDAAFKEKKKKGWLILTTFFLILFLIFFALVFGLERAYAGKFYPRVKIGNLDVSGQNIKSVENNLKNFEAEIQNQGLSFKANGQEIKVNPVNIAAADPDLAKPVLVFGWPQTINAAYQVGRNSNPLKNLTEKFQLLVLGREIPVYYRLDETELLNILKNNFSALEKQPTNAGLEITGNNFEITGEKSGYVFDYQKAVDQLKINLNQLNTAPITLDLNFTEPEIKKNETGQAQNILEKALALNALTLTYKKSRWEIAKNEFTPWLEFQKFEGEIVVGFNQEKIYDFLNKIGTVINVEAKEAKFKMTGDRVTEFEASQDGQELDLAATYKKINAQLILGENKEIELVVKITPAKIATAELNNLGIKELLGRGVSNFKGSPKNRRHNITVGAVSLNGILIAPGEEFSLLKALGPVDAEHGYKPELVIKGDRTIPEFGGWLCQIGTTTFRAALSSGLPITQRRNHSYRVIYYEPAGMDATIYDPAPDFRFLNDTKNYILFTTKIVGDDLIFEFYGTRDGRQVDLGPNPPKIYNIVSPGEPRYVETEELKPGEKKKVESAHAGADTYFKYTVTYADGTVKEQDFYSHYVPWKEVWLVGKEPSVATTTESLPEIQN